MGNLSRPHRWRHSWVSHQACLPTKPGTLSGPTCLAPTLLSQHNQRLWGPHHELSLGPGPALALKNVEGTEVRLCGPRAEPSGIQKRKKLGQAGVAQEGFLEEDMGSGVVIETPCGSPRTKLPRPLVDNPLWVFPR